MTGVVTHRAPFFVQERPREPWHVETSGDPELMLCGLTISVDNGLVGVARNRKFCPACLRKLKEIECAQST